jgi:hypothetical protein
VIKEGPHADDLVDRRPVDPPPVVELLLDNAFVYSNLGGKILADNIGHVAKLNLA